MDWSQDVDKSKLEEAKDILNDVVIAHVS